MEAQKIRDRIRELEAKKEKIQSACRSNDPKKIDDFLDLLEIDGKITDLEYALLEQEAEGEKKL